MTVSKVEIEDESVMEVSRSKRKGRATDRRERGDYEELSENSNEIRKV